MCGVMAAEHIMHRIRRGCCITLGYNFTLININSILLIADIEISRVPYDYMYRVPYDYMYNEI